MSAIRVRKFDPTKMKESRISLLIGKRHTGKSVLMKDLLSNMPRPDYVLAMAPTEDTLRMFREFLPESCIFDHFSQDKLERTVSLQRELVTRGKKRTVLIICDDIMYNKNVLKSAAMRSIFFNGRHDHIGLMIAAQYMMDIDVSLRTNIDYVFTMRENILTNRQKLYKYYFGQFPKFDDFDKVMSACTQDYRALVLDGTVSVNSDPTDSVLWYKAATEIPDFKLCRPVYWKWAKRYGIDDDAVRRAQQKAFEIETAAAEASALAASSTNSGVTTLPGGKRKGSSSLSTITMVQTEDENGQVVSNTV